MRAWREGILEHVVYPAGTDPGEGEMGDVGQWGEGTKSLGREDGPGPSTCGGTTTARKMMWEIG